MNKPRPGEFFISTQGNFCIMRDESTFHDYTFKNAHLNLYYVPGDEQYSKLRDATPEEIKVKQTLNNVTKGKDMNGKFEIELEEGHDLAKGLQNLEAAYIEFVHKLAKYNQSRTARWLGISRGTLRTKLKEYFGDAYL